MPNRLTALGLACGLSLATGCDKNNPAPRPAPTTARADAGTARDAATTDNTPLVPPTNAMLVIRGSALRKVVTLIAPGELIRPLLGRRAPEISPGMGEHGVDVNPDVPFAAVMLPKEGGTPGQLSGVMAWPLRDGVSIVQDAQAGRGYRESSPGVYQPTSSDAGAGNDNECWVARKPAEGWAMVCGPHAQVTSTVSFLLRASAAAPSANTVLDLTFRPEPARPVLAAQLALLEAQNPRLRDAGIPELVTQFEEARRQANTWKEVVDDLSALHLALTLDDETYHLHAEGDLARASGPTTRALVASTVGRRAAIDLLGALPAGANPYFAIGLDSSALAPILGSNAPDPRVARALGPEFVRFQEGLQNLTELRRAGDRAIGFLNEEGGTQYQVLRVPDAAAAVTNLRNLATAVPRTPRPGGANPGDQFAVLPTPPGVPAGSLRLRLGPDPARLPPNAPPEARRMYQRSALFVPQNDRLYILEAQDPAARWAALEAGQKLNANVPEGHAAVAHLTPAALFAMIGVPPNAGIPAGNDPVHATLRARRLGDDGGHFEAEIEAPTTSVTQLLALYMLIQQQQAMMQERMRQAMVEQQRAAQQAAAARRQGGRPGMMLPVPTSPDQLPEPNFQLRPPGQ